MSNVGSPDRILRLIAGLALVAVPLVIGLVPWSGALALVGAVLIATAAFSFCPIYALFGLSSKGNHSPGNLQ